VVFLFVCYTLSLSAEGQETTSLFNNLWGAALLSMKEIKAGVLYDQFTREADDLYLQTEKRREKAAEPGATDNPEGAQ